MSFQSEYLLYIGEHLLLPLSAVWFQADYEALFGLAEFFLSFFLFCGISLESHKLQEDVSIGANCTITAAR